MLHRTHVPRASVFGTNMPDILRFAYFTPEQLEEHDEIRLVVRNREGATIWSRTASVESLQSHLVGGIKHSNGRSDNVRLILHAQTRTDLELQGVLH